MRRTEILQAYNPKVAFLNLPVVDILHNAKKQWNSLQNEASKNRRFAFRKIDIDWNEYNTNDYLFTHASIVSSVETDKTGYRIIEPCEELVNANGNAWTNQVLPHCFRTFVGGFNFVEHVQIPELSKGKILDAILRPVVYIGRNGKKKANVYYVDILIATARKFDDLVSRIEDGTLSTLSMGCIANVTQCSACGKLIRESDENCNHLEQELGKFIEDATGKYIVSELVGALDEKGKYIEHSCDFIEASWVEQPAFEGAVSNFFIESPQTKDNLITSDKMNSEMNKKLAMLFEDERTFSKLKVADKRSLISMRLAIKEIRMQKYFNMTNNVANSIN